MPQVQIPDFVGQNRAYAQERQNALLTQSRLKGAEIEQGEAQRSIQKRNELEQLLMRTPEHDRDRAGLEWAKVNDQKLYGDLTTNHIRKLQQLLPINPPQALAQFERATGEKVDFDPAAGVATIQVEGGPPLAVSVRGQVMQLDQSKIEKPLATRVTEAEQLAAAQTRGRVSETPPPPVRPDQNLSAVELFNQDPEKYGAMREIDAKMAAKYRREPRDPNQPTAYQTKRLEVDLRKEFNSSPIVKDYDQVRKQTARMESAMEQAKTSKNFVAIDQALVIGLNKMSDPGSAVMQGEYARTIQNSPLLSRARGKIDQIMSGGGGFTNDERNAIASLMRAFYKDAESLYLTHASEYERLAEGGGLDRSRVVIKRDTIGPKAGSGGAARIVQRNKKTGAYRHSDDGGQTWQPGQ